MNLALLILIAAYNLAVYIYINSQFVIISNIFIDQIVNETSNGKAFLFRSFLHEI